MRDTLIRSTGIAALAALLAPLASAGPCGQPQEPACPATPSRVLNSQIQFGDVFADMDVQMPYGGGAAVGAAAGYGNVSSGSVISGDIDYDADQTMGGDAKARTTITTGGSTGTVVGATTAYGNASSGGSWNGETYYRAEQTMTGDTEARTAAYIVNAGDVAVGSTAAANVSAASGEYGTIRNFVIQDSDGSVTSSATVEACCTGNSAQIVSNAVGNSTASTGAATTSYSGAVQTTAAGERIESYAGYRSPQSYGTTIAASAAAGNSATVDNSWGYATLGRNGSELYQEQRSTVGSSAYVTVTDSFSGLTSASAYGVGNSALISNVGSDTGLYANQFNYGDVASAAGLSGGSWTGGAGLVNSVAIGNAASAYVCAVCGPAQLQGGLTQYNAGNTTAIGTAYTPAAGLVSGAAIAVGNTATYQSSGPGH